MRNLGTRNLLTSPDHLTDTKKRRSRGIYEFRQHEQPAFPEDPVTAAGPDPRSLFSPCTPVPDKNPAAQLPPRFGFHRHASVGRSDSVGRPRILRLHPVVVYPSISRKPLPCTGVPRGIQRALRVEPHEIGPRLKRGGPAPKRHRIRRVNLQGSEEEPDTKLFLQRTSPHEAYLVLVHRTLARLQGRSVQFRQALDCLGEGYGR